MSPIEAFITTPGAVLQFSGEDHLNFLQGQGTADFRGPSGICRYSLWLDHKGLIHGDAHVLKIDDTRVVLVSYETPASRLLEMFQKHIIADDVEIQDHTEEWNLLSLPGGSAVEFLKDRPIARGPNTVSIEADGFLFDGHRLGEGTLDYLVPVSTRLPIDIKEISPEEAERTRIEAGIPSIEKDIRPGRFNPVEGNLVHAVSFDKGCYLGQEVVARVHRLKRMSKRLVRASGSGPAPEMPCALVCDDNEVGQLTSVAEYPDRFLAMGWLKSRIPDGEHAFKGLSLAVESLSAS